MITTQPTADKLKSLNEHIRRLEEDKAAVAEDIKDIYTEAKASGFDAKIMRQVIKLRKLSADQRAEMDELTRVYLEAVS